ncbi:MAG: hypothetical protein FIA97_08595, partial [Methylococcaceae bacterium]|nr:hypothetical protein [Methylococcaceae bacterium]
NIKELSLGDIWRSEPVKLLRSGFYEAKYPKICRNCTQYINLDFFRTSIGTKQALSIDRPRPNLESNG